MVRWESMDAGSTTFELSALLDCIKSPPVAYFCAEFAVDEKLPIYAGGLGILAGDVLCQAHEDGRPYVGVGMLYHGGYLRQEISKDANIHTTENLDPIKSNLKLLVDQGKPVQITVPIHARAVQVKAWVQMIGDVPLILLDTDVEGNEAQDIKLCDQLYVGDREHRFKQEMILGIGGARMIHRIGIRPKIYHLNEGHSALLLFEVAKDRITNGTNKNVQEVLEHLENIVFTNHTLVPAGNDVFSKDLVISYLSSFALEFPMDPAILVKFGLIQDTSLFSPTMLALRLATVNTAVSTLHATKALEMWADHPMIGITNGVRQKFWQVPELAQASAEEADKIWSIHTERKKKLLEYIKESTGFVWPEDAMVITWARRLANYKRPLLLFEQMERLEALLSHTPPVRLLMSGKPHAHDEAAQENLKKILELVGKYDGKVVYLQNYSIDMAKLMHSGSDVLLNTPIRGFEACGTSGMKASMNGVLQCTTLDGWTDEVNWDGIGWIIDDANAGNSLYDHLEKEIVPLYFQRNSEGIPTEWVERMKKTIAVAIPQYTAKRMLEELDTKVYSQIKTQ